MSGSSHQSSPIKSLSCDELEEFLMGKGIKPNVCKILKGERILQQLLNYLINYNYIQYLQLQWVHMYSHIFMQIMIVYTDNFCS